MPPSKTYAELAEESRLEHACRLAVDPTQNAAVRADARAAIARPSVQEILAKVSPAASQLIALLLAPDDKLRPEERAYIARVMSRLDEPAPSRPVTTPVVAPDNATRHADPVERQATNLHVGVATVADEERDRREARREAAQRAADELDRQTRLASRAASRSWDDVAGSPSWRGPMS